MRRRLSKAKLLALMHAEYSSLPAATYKQTALRGFIKDLELMQLVWNNNRRLGGAAACFAAFRLCHALGRVEHSGVYKALMEGLKDLDSGVVPSIFEPAPAPPNAGARKPAEHNDLLVTVSSYLDALRKSGMRLKDGAKLIAKVLNDRSIKLGRGESTLEQTIIGTRADISTLKRGTNLYRAYQHATGSLDELMAPFDRKERRSLLLHMLESELDRLGARDSD